MGLSQDLDYVKNVIGKEYTVVGTLEKLDNTMDLLEKKIPHFFKGMKEMYKAKGIVIL